MTAKTAIGSLAARLAAGETLFLAWCGLADVGAADILLREGFDAALFDMQHGAPDIGLALAGIPAAAAASKPAMVRIPVGDFALASRMLDAGAASVVAPMINSVADARAFAAFTKYPPLGERSWGPYRAQPLSGLGVGAFLEQANDIQLAIAMIETREALAALDDILSVDGIDGVLVGPSDLSITLTDGKTIDPNLAEVDEAMTKVAAAAQRHRKIASAFCADGTRARALAGRGFRLLTVGSDQGLLRLAAKAELAKARG